MRSRLGFYSATRSPHQMQIQVAFKGSFSAFADDGAHQLIDVFQLINAETQAEYGGSVIYRTPDGRAVDWIRTGVYEIKESRLTPPLNKPTTRWFFPRQISAIKNRGIRFPPLAFRADRILPSGRAWSHGPRPPFAFVF